MELSLFVDDGSKKLSALVYSKGVPKFTSGNVVFLLHGFQDNAASFYKLAPMLTERTNFTFVCLEFSGHGKSDHAGVSNHFNYVFDVIDAANALRVEKFGLIGHSMGAIVSLMLAGSALDRVTFCVAIDTLGMIGTKSDQESAILLQKSLAQRSEILKRQPRIYSSMEECISRWKMSALAPLGDENVAALVERSVEFIVDDSLNSSPGFRFRHDPRLKALSPFRVRRE
jgi:pimeloyl-ACP methyl ester carboxylesterase